MRATRALVAVTASAVVLVTLQVGTFSSRFSPHLLGRDLAALPPRRLRRLRGVARARRPASTRRRRRSRRSGCSRCSRRCRGTTSSRRTRSPTRSASRSCSTTRSAGGRRPSSRSSERSFCSSFVLAPRLELIAVGVVLLLGWGTIAASARVDYRDRRGAGRARRRAARLDRPQRLVGRRLRLQRRPRSVDGRVGAAVLEPAHRPRRLDHPPLRAGADRAAPDRAPARRPAPDRRALRGRERPRAVRRHPGRRTVARPEPVRPDALEAAAAGAAVDARRRADPERRHHRDMQS